MPTIEIKDCRECPKSKETRIYTSDSWELVMGVFCTLKPKGKESTDEYNRTENARCGMYETFDKHTIMPKWCPLDKK